MRRTIGTICCEVHEVHAWLVIQLQYLNYCIAYLFSEIWVAVMNYVSQKVMIIVFAFWLQLKLLYSWQWYFYWSFALSVHETLVNCRWISLLTLHNTIDKMQLPKNLAYLAQQWKKTSIKLRKFFYHHVWWNNRTNRDACNPLRSNSSNNEEINKCISQIAVIIMSFR